VNRVKTKSVFLTQSAASLRWARPWFGRLSRFLHSSVLGAGSLIFLIILILVALFSGQIAPYGALDQDYTVLLKAPSWSHPAGTDNLGRDVFSRVLIGAKTTLYVAFMATVIGDGIGFTWGIATGYVGGRLDLLSQRLLDILFSFPGVILALMLLVSLGAGVNTIIVAIAVTRIPGSARVIRSTVLSVKEMDYVKASEAAGANPIRIMVFHVAPQAVAPLLIVFAGSLGGAIFAEAALSFLGLGIPPPEPSWGNMLGGVLVQSFNPSWWLVVAPGMIITLTILSLNLLGDALRDHLDPKLRGRL
jgi:peptide/nickel transport system permease protein